MWNEKMRQLGACRSVIRELFEFGKKRKSEIGAENVFDYSLGNPSVPAPDAVREALSDLVNHTDPVALHGYTSAPGDLGVRKAIAEDLNARFGASVDPDLVYMTVGAAASLTCSLTALCNPGDEVVLLAPFFPEYRVFTERTGATPVVVLSDLVTFQPDFEALDRAIGKKTRAIIVNSPNNPSGAVLTEESVKKLADLLRRKEKEFGEPIYLISDEPYRELVYDGTVVPFLTNYYDDTVVCYSFSKSLSLPGERIGYVLVSPRASDAPRIYEAIAGAGRALGFVCAPSLFQYMIPKVLSCKPDLAAYDHNRRLLYDSLTSFGFSAVRPDGAFYLFLKSPSADANAFSEKAKEYELLLVPSDSFGCPGYVRLSYCVSGEMIERSLPAFRKLAEFYGLLK